jgi:phage baseplate assembly protein W
MKDIKILQLYTDFNDFTIQNNDIQLIENENKLAQDVVKIMLTIKGSHFLFKNYGTNLAAIVNTRNTEFTDNLKQEIIYALEYVKSLNKNETINLDKILSVDISSGSNYYNIILKIMLTNKKMLTLNI